ncbi:MAG TPA: hypothetical protein VFR97_08475 [Capillimicrobium sp.]|nr:hypothetical protein [Capillimicrobium sp.]
MPARSLIPLALAAFAALLGAAAPASARPTDDDRYRVVSASGHRTYHFDGVSDTGEIHLASEHRFSLAKPIVVRFSHDEGVSIPVKGTWHVSSTITDTPPCDQRGRFTGEDALLKAQWQVGDQLVLGLLGADGGACAGGLVRSGLDALQGYLGEMRLSKADTERKTIRLSGHDEATNDLGDGTTETISTSATIVLKAV